MPPDPRIKNPLALAFPAGLNTRARETDLPKGSARSAVNIDFTREGHVILAAGGYTAVSGAAGGHSLWSWPDLGYALYVSQSGVLIRIRADGSRETVTAVSADRPMSYALFNRQAYFSNGEEMGYLEDGVLRPWGIDPPPPPFVNVIADGGLPAGRYLVAISVLYNDGEESAPSAPQTVVLKKSGGIALILPDSSAISHVLIYCSSTKAANGEELFYHGRVVKGAGSYLITAQAAGYRLNTLFLGRMPCGSLIAAFKRRLLSAVAGNLYFSELEQPSLCNRRHGWLPFDEPITAIAPVDDGCYIGTATKTYWCAGTDPTDWTRVVVRPFGIAYQASVPYLPNDAFPTDTSQGAAVPWFGQDGGLCVGRNGGFVQAVTQERVGIAPHLSATIFYRECASVRQVLIALQGAKQSERASIDTPTNRVERHGLAT